MIYLDHAATTPVPKAVADAMYTVLTEQYANPNAQYPFGQEMRRSVEDWRAVIAKAVGTTPSSTAASSWSRRAGRSRPSCRIKTATFPPNPFWRRCGRTRRWCP